MKYGGSMYDVLEVKLLIFRNNYYKVGIPQAHFASAISTMLKGPALSFYYHHLYQDNPNKSKVEYLELLLDKLTKIQLDVFTLEDQYSASTFQGIMPDSGAARFSTAGYQQLLALQRDDPSITLDTSTAGNANIRFGSGDPLVSLGTTTVPTPFGLITFHVVPTNTPFLLCLQDLDRLGIRFDNLTNVLQQGNTTVPVKATDEVRRIHARRQVADALAARNGPDTQPTLDLPIQSLVRVWREKQGWQGPFRLIATNGEDCTVDLPHGPRTFRSTVVKPYYEDPDEAVVVAQPAAAAAPEPAQPEERTADEIVVNPDPAPDPTPSPATVRRRPGRPRKRPLLTVYFFDQFTYKTDV
ncbi:hypothetical protein EsH8_VI_000169 [Colletotrichum jinshuiense]